MKTKIKMREKLAYGIGDLGCNFVWTPIGMFLTLYYTDSVGIAAGVVGTIMLLTRLLDGVTDLIFGNILDRTHTKMGKARPWILRSTPMMVFGLLLLFNVPSGLGDSGKVVYAVITYVFIAAVAYTISNLSYNALLSLMTDDQQERASMSSIRFLMVTIVAILIASVTMPLVHAIGWTGVSILFAALSAVCFMITIFGTKERVSEQKKETEEEKLPTLEAFRYLLQNKYFVPIMLLFIFTYIKGNISSGINIYFVRNVLGNENLMAPLSLAGTIPLLVAYPLFPLFVRKFGKWKCMLVGILVSMVSSIVILLNPHSIPVILVGGIFNAVATIPMNAGLFALVGDGVDYGEWKTGVRQDGMFNSVVSFGMKVGTGIGSALVGWGLAWGHYNAAAATQSAETLRAITLIGYGLPVVCLALSLICLWFCNIDKIYPQMAKDLAERRANAEA